MKVTKLIAACCLFATSMVQANAQNPIIRDQFSADPTARVFEGKIFVFPSHDIPAPDDFARKDWFCMADYHVFSSEDLCEWTDHGNIVDQKDVPWGNPKGYSMWAPDCVNKDGKYYFYFPNAPKSGMGFGIGIATATNPAGPYTIEPEPMQGARGIDPCVLQASDGNNYIFYGGGSIQVAKMTADMKGIEGRGERINLPSGFVEGPFAFERNGKYYLTYPWVRGKKGEPDPWGGVWDNATECLAYSMSDNPMGPYEFKGIIMEESRTGCWTNHHSILEYKGQWYLFYHHNDYSPKFDKNRSVCADSLFFNPDGTIQQVKPTKRGIGITNAAKQIQIDRYSEVGGDATIEYLDTTNYFQGWKAIFPKAGAWMQYNKVELKAAAKNITVRLNSTKAGSATVQLSSKYKVDVKLPSTNGKWQEVKVAIKAAPKGIYDLKITANSAMDIDWVSLQ